MFECCRDADTCRDDRRGTAAGADSGGYCRHGRPPAVPRERPARGRAPATRGGRLAAEYIAVQFQALGLEPAGANGTYFQPVALVGMTPQPALAWGLAGGAADTLAYRDAFVAWGERPEADITASGEVVFVGYGIRAPEWRWDDYKGADLHGKVLLMLVNDPGLVDSTVFLGKILTYYGRWTYKLEEAARQGAAGAILVHTT